jgi:hypothetical protein
MPRSVRLDKVLPEPISFGKVTDFERHIRLHHMEDIVAEIEECAWTVMNRQWNIWLSEIKVR